MKIKVSTISSKINIAELVQKTQIMILRTHNSWLVPVALTFITVVSGATKALAQTTLPFDTFYDTEVVLEPVTPNVSKAFISGFNPDAPYGLTNFTSINYSQFNPQTNTFTFVPDAAQFGLEGLSVGTDAFFGSGEDQLFGRSNATAVINLTNNTLDGSGTVTITGGTGRFSNAAGILNFSETESLAQDPTAPLKGKAFLNGTIEVVPEPETEMGTLVGIGVIGASFLMRRRSRKAISGYLNSK